MPAAKRPRVKEKIGKKGKQIYAGRYESAREFVFFDAQRSHAQIPSRISANEPPNAGFNDFLEKLYGMITRRD